MPEQMDTQRVRNLLSLLYPNAVGTHFDGCEYVHFSCMILALCKELDEVRERLEQATRPNNLPD